VEGGEGEEGGEGRERREGGRGGGVIIEHNPTSGGGGRGDHGSPLCTTVKLFFPSQGFTEIKGSPMEIDIMGSPQDS